MNDNEIGIDKQESAIADGIQAPLINRFHMRATPQTVRVVFFETYNIPIARAACSMSIDDAIAFQRHLGEIIARVAPQHKGH